MSNHDVILDAVYDNVIDGLTDETVTAVEEALEASIPANVILNDALIAGMREVGKLFETGELFVPEMLIAADAMKAALKILRPHLVTQGVQPIGKFIIGTVKGDVHDIGKSLVSMMCEGEGFEVVDLGINVDPEKFVEAVKEGGDILGLSALLTTTMMAMEKTIKAITDAGLRDSIKIMVGGAPITQDFADQIGADGFAKDAAAAARLARQWIDETS